MMLGMMQLSSKSVTKISSNYKIFCYTCTHICWIFSICLVSVVALHDDFHTTVSTQDSSTQLNTAIKVGADVALVCESFLMREDKLQWRYFKKNMENFRWEQKPLATYSESNSQFQTSRIFRNVGYNATKGRLTLVIYNASFENAGRYSCLDSAAAARTEYVLELLVIGIWY
jgi:hypothetical protein